MLAFVHDLQISGDMHSLVLGGGLIAAAALLYAIYNAGSEVAIRRMGSMKFSVLALLVSSLATQTHFYLAQPLSALNLPWQVYLWCGAMALFSTVLPIFWQSAAVQRIGAERAVLIGLLGPMLTVFFSWWLLGEPISLAQIAGTLLVMAGVLVVLRH
ncbi:DMT family transporter [Klebsiella oxytoca]